MIRNRLVKTTSLAMALVFMCSAVGCSKSKYTGRFSWIDSNLYENADKVKGIRLQDDFAAAACADWITSQTYDPVLGNSTYSEAGVIVDNNKRAMINDSSVTGKNLELVRAFDKLYSNWDKRNEIGSEPLRKYLERISRISSVKDVQDYMLDNDGNPFAVMLVNLGTTRCENNKDHLCLNVTQPDYSIYSSDASASDTRKAIVFDQVSHILSKLGYSESDVQSIVDQCAQFEAKLAGINPDGYYVSYTDTAFGKDELLSSTASFDLNRILDHYDLGRTANYLGDLKYLKGLDSVFTNDNIKGMKAYFTVQLVTKSMLLLDRDSFDYSQLAAINKSNPDAKVDVSYEDRYLFRTIEKSPLSGAIDQAYLDYYYDQKVYDDITGILNDLVSEYKKIINEKDWLSDDSKARIIDKLENIRFNVIKPSNEADYGDMTLLSYDEGGTILDAYCKLNKFKITHYGDLTEMQYDREFWDIYDNRCPTTKVSDYYDTSRNVIVVTFGILNGGIYSYDMSFEEKLANIGTILGHEMSHAFDATGVYYDKNGDYNALLSGNDMDYFDDKASDVTEYFDGITPYDGCVSYSSDNDLRSETIADMGGMRAALMVAAEQDSFDYDKFFRSYASLWQKLTDKGSHYDSVLTDNHPLPYLRVNVTVQQFEEFYKTYNVQPEDKMYLPPEERIAIW